MQKLDRQDIGEILALTPMQEGMLFHYLEEPGSDSYLNQLSLEIWGKINRQYFEEAWNVVIKTNEILRTVFRWEKLEKPIQVVLKRYTINLKYEDLSTVGDIEEKRKEWEKIKQQDREKKFDLREVPLRVILGKTDENIFQVLIGYHHILYDGWSSGIILKELFQAYEALATGGQPLIPPVKPGFKEFIQWNREQDRQEQKKFWQNYLEGFDNPTRLPIKRLNQSRGVPGGRNYLLHLGGGLKDKLEIFVKENRLTLAAVFYCAWGILLQKYCNSRDVVFGTIVSGRSVPIRGIEDMVGLFINTIPLRAGSEPGKSRERMFDFLVGMNRHLAAREKYENTPLVDIYSYCRQREQGGGELFDSIVAVENYPVDTYLKDQDNGLRIRSYSMEETPHYDLTLVISSSGEIDVNFIYNNIVFDEECVIRLARHFGTILKGMGENVENRVHETEMLSGEEKHQLLVDFNSERSAYPGEKAINELFVEQVERTPDHVALIGTKLQNTKYKLQTKYKSQITNYKQNHLTYKELNEKTNGLAILLIEKGIQSGTIVGIMMQRSIEMVIGILGILKAGGAYLPIDPDYPQERIQYILKDSGASIFLTYAEMELLFEKITKTFVSSVSSVAKTNLAYIIYTSGSTGRPKGVMVEHGAVVNLLFALHGRYPLTKGDAYLLKTSYLFDVSVTELFGWFLGGGRLVVPEAGGEKDPAAILAMIVREGVTHINFVPSMFQTFVETLDSRGIVELPGLKYIFLAGEALLPGVVNRFRGFHTCVAVENIYGPTEAAVYSSWYSLSDWHGVGPIPIGRPLPNVTLFILDNWCNVQPVGVPGELCISGMGLARGYLNNPELTAEKFIAHELHELHEERNFHLTPNTKHLTLYRTGDLCCWLPDGNIEFLGRIDHQVKVRGFRIELGEIESRLVGHEGVKHAVVMVKKDESGDAFLCAYVVPSRGKPVEIPGLRDYLRQKLPGYMVPAYFVILEAIPLTSSGKIDRKSLPEPGKIPVKGLTAPRDDLERRLVEIWRGVLGVDKHMLGIDSNFFDCGGHSLKAARLLSRIHKTLNVGVPLAQMFKTPCIRGMASYIRTCSQAGANVIEKTEEKEYYPLSPAQKRLYILYQMDRESTGYNVPYFALMEGDVKRSTWEDTIKKLIARHESLRTSFIVVGSEAVQQVHDEAVFDIEYYDTGPEAAGGGGANSFTRPFDLSRAPLLRLGLARLERAKYLFMLDMHHIISDLFSHLVFIKDFIDLYGDNAPGPSFLQYKDFCRWQSREAQQKEMKKQEAYWLNIFGGSSPQLNMPIDYPRSRVYRFEGRRSEFKLDESLTHRVRGFVEDSGITLNILFLAVYNLLLWKYTQQEDIVVGTPIFGRRHNDLYGIIGFFSNMLPIKTRLFADQHFTRLLEAIKDNYFNAYENQDYPFDDLVWKLGSERDPGRLSLVETVLVVVPREFEETQRQAIRDLEKMGIKLTPCSFDLEVSHFDLMVHATECGNGINAFIEYRTALFKPSTIEGMVKHFIEVLEQVLEDKGRRLKEITITPFTLSAKANLLQDEQDDWELE